MLNGRNFVKNDFMSVSVKGCSVVDYCLVSHENLSDCCDFSVERAVDLISRAGDISALAPAGFPDHSVLTWNLNFNVTCNQLYLSDPKLVSSTDKFNVTAIPDSSY